MPVVPHLELGVHVRGAGEEDSSAQVKVSHSFIAVNGLRRLPSEAREMPLVSRLRERSMARVRGL